MSATTVAVRERPILFSGPMVRAILDGTKTQTRRAMKPQPVRSWLLGQPMWGHRDLGGNFGEHVFGGCASNLLKCPYGVPGDRLWVRERFRTVSSGQKHPNGGTDVRYGVAYEADSSVHWSNHTTRIYADPPIGTYRDVGTKEIKWSPSIHMRRDWSRLTLEITDVRVQRVQEISSADAWQEGIRPDGVSEHPGDGGRDRCDPIAATIEGFVRLWDSINAKRGYPWESNPWVFALSFRRVEL